MRAGADAGLIHAIVHRPDGKLIGHLIWHPWIVPGVWEIGWLLHRRYWRQGLATELTAAVLELARLLPEVERVIGKTDPENAPSIAALQRSGFVRAPELDDDLPVWVIPTPSTPSMQR